MTLEEKSQKLKSIIATYDSEWLLGDLSFLIHSGKDKAFDQLAKLSSPLRQLTYLAGLNITSEPKDNYDFRYTREKWDKIVILLNEIEEEYEKLFYANKPEEITDEWKRIRSIAMPSFLSYFNQGPLNYEEQVISWITDLFKNFDNIIEDETNLKTEDFIQFYNNLDQVHQKNFQALMGKKELLRPNWDKYSKIKTGVVDGVPESIKKYGEEHKNLFAFLADRGIKDRFYPEEIVSPNLSLEKVNTILKYLSIEREPTNFLYYTDSKPNNPIFERPILNIGNGMFQVFEIKQVIHSIENLLEQLCTKTVQNTTKYSEKKGNLLEKKIIELFSDFFKTDFQVYHGYYVDGCEQDILFIWKNCAFIIEAKGYSLREPLRNPDKAFIRIKDDFNNCIGYAYEQTKRVEKKIIDGNPFNLTDKKGNVIVQINPADFDYDFSIIINLKSFGQIQCDLSTLLKLENEDYVYPWCVKLDDIEVFLLTLMAQKKSPNYFIDFLLMRENLHEKLICSDELEICGAFITKKLTVKAIKKAKAIITTPELSNLFDKQYNKGLGFKDEKLLQEKKSKEFIFW